MKQKEISAWKEINDDFFGIAKVTTIFFEMTFQGANKLKEFEIFDKPTISRAWSTKVVHKNVKIWFWNFVLSLMWNQGGRCLVSKSKIWK